MVKRHVIKLLFHAALLTAALIIYFTCRDLLNFTSLFSLGFSSVFLWIVWATLVVNMLFRIFPNKHIAVGARKHYKCSYRTAQSLNHSKNAPCTKPQLHRGAALCAIGWFVISAGLLITMRLTGILSPATILILMLIYSVTDLCFILFFCPFQTLFMHNQCCVTCRIYNWDYFMMCAPLILFPNFFSASLVVLSSLVVVIWELAMRKNPQYFLSEKNDNLNCASCEDKLCYFRKEGKR